jgi:hypothetical protein
VGWEIYSRGQWEGPGYLSISIISRWVEEIYRAGVKPVLSRLYEKINYSRRFRNDFFFLVYFFYFMANLVPGGIGGNYFYLFCD